MALLLDQESVLLLTKSINLQPNHWILIELWLNAYYDILNVLCSMESTYISYTTFVT